MTGDPVAAALADLDARLARLGLAIWIGAEPTFTLASSTAPCWTWQAEDEGGEKLARAVEVVRAMAAPLGVRSVHRVVGRQYPDEDAPRFCLGVVFGWAGQRRPPWGEPERAALAAQLDALAAATPGGRPLLLTTSNPPIPGDDCWLTVTPDPGVVEINSAPCPDGVSFLDHLRAIYAAATAAGLSPRRLRFHGEVTDSGGGGQLTLGGPTPEDSPFFVHPALLPRLVRYVNDHPSLSYWFLGDCAGAASQSPRADEGVRERWEELRLATRTLERLADSDVTPDLLWRTLAPLLVDASGNSHRAELNVEKLWSPHLGQRGRMGVVELRAFQMPATPEQLAAAAALVRAVAARCALAPYESPARRGDEARPGDMLDWGAELHDRMALPVYLRADLEWVLRDLDAHGVGLGAVLEALAVSYRQPALWTGAPWPGVAVTLSRALEFWPLLGDTASQEGRTSRLVDASSERLELRIEMSDELAPPTITAGGGPRATDRPLAPVLAAQRDGRATWIVGVRRRVYLPEPGLHPAIAALDPLELRVVHAARVLTLRLFGWKPDGGPYDGVPADAEEAARRRAARLVATVTSLAADGDGYGRADTAPEPGDPAGPCTVDLRDPP